MGNAPLKKIKIRKPLTRDVHMAYPTTLNLPHFPSLVSPIPSSLSPTNDELSNCCLLPFFFVVSPSLSPSQTLSISPAISFSISSSLINGGQDLHSRWLIGVHALMELGQMVPNWLGPAQLMAKHHCWQWWQHVQKPRRDDVQTVSSSHFSLLFFGPNKFILTSSPK